MDELFHGVGLIFELELLEQADLSPLEILRTATTTPAKMFGLEQDLGSLAPGKVADMVFLKENPLNGMKALRQVKWTMRAGNLKSPSEWRNAASSPACR